MEHEAFDEGEMTTQRFDSDNWVSSFKIKFNFWYKNQLLDHNLEQLQQTEKYLF